MKKKIILIIILIIIITIPILLNLNLVIQNNKYEKKLLEDIYANTNIENINYINKDNNYYIIKNKEEVLVMNLNYEEVYKVSLEELKDNTLELTYYRNNLYYKERVREKDKLTYKFYDVKTNDFVYSVVVGGL